MNEILFLKGYERNDQVVVVLLEGVSFESWELGKNKMHMIPNTVYLLFQAF